MQTTALSKNASKRTAGERERDYPEIAKMYLQGETQADIAREISSKRHYSLSRAQIAFDLKKIKGRWLESSLVDFDQIKAKELAKIDVLERAYWEGWDRSCKNQEETQAEKVEDKNAAGNPSYSRTKAKKIEKNRDGDVTFLHGVQWCIDQRCKIFGLLAPQRLQVDWREEAKKAGVDPSIAFNDIVAKYVEEARANRSDMDGDDGSRGVERS